MNKITLGVLVVAVGALAYVFLTRTKKVEPPKPETVPGYLTAAEQQVFRDRKQNPILFITQKDPDRSPPPYDEVEITRQGVTVRRVKDVAAAEAEAKKEDKAQQKKDEDFWSMKAPVEAECEGHKVRRMLETFALDTLLMPGKKVSKKEFLSDFGLDEKAGIRVVLKQKGVTRVALMVGKLDQLDREDAQQNPEETDTFVLLDSQEGQVFRAKKKDLRTPFDEPPEAIRSKKLFPFEPEDIARITIENPADAKHPKIVLAATWTDPPADGAKDKDAAKDGKKDAAKPKKATATWALEEPKIPGFQLKDMKSFAEYNLAKLRVMEFLMGEKPGPETGLLDPKKVARITVELRRGGAKKHVLLVGDPKEPKRSRYAMLEGHSELLVLSDSNAANLLKGLTDLREPLVLGVTKDEDITRMEITNESTGAGSLVFERDGAGWKMTAPVAQVPFDREVKGLVSGLRYFRVADFLDAKPEKGLEKPTVTIKATISGAEKTVVCGEERDSKTLCHLEGTDLYFKVGSYTTDKFKKKKAEDFRDKVVLKLDAAKIKSLSLVHSDGVVMLERMDASRWRMTQPKAIAAETGLNDAAVNALARQLAKLEIADHTDKKPADVGLDKPIFTLTATLADGTVATVKVSDQKSGEAPYVSVSGPGAAADAVFTMDKWRIKNLQKKAADLEKTAGKGAPPGLPHGMPVAPPH